MKLLIIKLQRFHSNAAGENCSNTLPISWDYSTCGTCDRFFDRNLTSFECSFDPFHAQQNTFESHIPCIGDDDSYLMVKNKRIRDYCRRSCGNCGKNSHLLKLFEKKLFI